MNPQIERLQARLEDMRRKVEALFSASRSGDPRL